MSSYHRPKLFRSKDGCCICKAKSSSSRFTNSRRYQALFPQCFQVEDSSREGDICNACVLLVKRYKKLPTGTDKNWKHMVDSRQGPGTKATRAKRHHHHHNLHTHGGAVRAGTRSTTARQDQHTGADGADNKKPNAPASPSGLSDDIAYEQRSMSGSDSDTSDSAVSMSAPVYMDDSSSLADADTASMSATVRSSSRRKRKPTDKHTSALIDLTYWKRVKVCCGYIYKGRRDDCLIDLSIFKPCAVHSKTQQHTSNSTTQQHTSNSTTQQHASSSTTTQQHTSNSTTQQHTSSSTTQQHTSSSTTQQHTSSSTTTQQHTSNSTTQQHTSSSSTTTQQHTSNSTSQQHISKSTTQQHISKSTTQQHIDSTTQQHISNSTTQQHTSSSATQQRTSHSSNNVGNRKDSNTKQEYTTDIPNNSVGAYGTARAYGTATESSSVVPPSVGSKTSLEHHGSLYNSCTYAKTNVPVPQKPVCYTSQVHKHMAQNYYGSRVLPPTTANSACCVEAENGVLDLSVRNKTTASTEAKCDNVQQQSATHDTALQAKCTKTISKLEGLLRSPDLLVAPTQTGSM